MRLIERSAVPPETAAELITQIPALAETLKGATCLRIVSRLDPRWTSERCCCIATANVKAKTVLETELRALANAKVSATKSDASIDSLLAAAFEMGRRKRWLVPQIAALWQSHSSSGTLSPFCGGACRGARLETRASGPE